MRDRLARVGGEVEEHPQKKGDWDDRSIFEKSEPGVHFECPVVGWTSTLARGQCCRESIDGRG